MADPKYLSVDDFKSEAPESRLAELSQDTPNSFTPDDMIISKALLWAEGIFESKITSRSDYVIKQASAIEGSKDASTVKEFIYDVAMWKLFKRREHIPEAIQLAFDTQMTWITDVVNRKADLPIFDSNGDQIDMQSHQPVINENAKNEFDDWSY